MKTNLKELSEAIETFAISESKEQDMMERGKELSTNASSALMKAIGKIKGLKTSGLLKADSWGNSHFNIEKDGERWPVRMVVQDKLNGNYIVSFEVQTPMMSDSIDYEFQSDLDDATHAVARKIKGSKYIADRWSKVFVELPDGKDPAGTVNTIVTEFPKQLAKYIKEEQSDDDVIDYDLCLEESTSPTRDIASVSAMIGLAISLAKRTRALSGISSKLSGIRSSLDDMVDNMDNSMENSFNKEYLSAIKSIKKVIS